MSRSDRSLINPRPLMEPLSSEHIEALRDPPSVAKQKTAYDLLYSFAIRVAEDCAVEGELSSSHIDLPDEEDVFERASIGILEVLERISNFPKVSPDEVRRSLMNAIWSAEQVEHYDDEVFAGYMLAEFIGPEEDQHSWMDEHTRGGPKEAGTSGVVPLYDLAPDLVVPISLRTDFRIVNQQLFQYLKKHPDLLYAITPRQFEEVVADLLVDMGYSVDLTCHGADGGVDIIAVHKSALGDTLCLVDCKRYAPNRHVGVGIVRSMFGIGESRRATMSMVATTSFFTKIAKDFQAPISHRLRLVDYDGLMQLVHLYK